MTNEFYIIKNLGTGKSLSRGADMPCETSSVIKVPIMISTLSAMKDKDDNLRTKLQVEPHHISNGSGIITWVKKRNFTIQELLKNILLYSDCTATNVLIDYCGGPDKINKSIQRTYKNTSLDCRYIMPHDHSTTVGTSTPADMLDLIESLYNCAVEYGNLSSKVAKWSKNSSTWFIQLLPEDFMPEIIKTGSMYHIGDGLDYVMNMAAILKSDAGSTYALAYFSNGKFIDDSDDAELAVKQSAANKIVAMIEDL